MFWLPTVGGSVRERNMRAQPWLTMTITEGDHDDHVVVLVEGTASVVAPADVPAGVRAAVSKTGLPPGSGSPPSACCPTPPRAAPGTQRRRDGQRMVLPASTVRAAPVT